MHGRTPPRRAVPRQGRPNAPLDASPLSLAADATDTAVARCRPESSSMARGGIRSRVLARFPRSRTKPNRSDRGGRPAQDPDLTGASADQSRCPHSSRAKIRTIRDRTRLKQPPRRSLSPRHRRPSRLGRPVQCRQKFRSTRARYRKHCSTCPASSTTGCPGVLCGPAAKRAAIRHSAHHAGRTAHDQLARRDIAGHHRSGGHKGFRANLDVGQQRNISANTRAASNGRAATLSEARLAAAHEVVVAGDDTGRDKAVLLDSRPGGDIRAGLELAVAADTDLVFHGHVRADDDAVADLATLAHESVLTQQALAADACAGVDDRARADAGSVTSGDRSAGGCTVLVTAGRGRRPSTACACTWQPAPSRVPA